MTSLHATVATSELRPQLSAASRRPWKISLGQALCLVYFVTFVASNASIDYEPSTSPAKHVIMMLIALLSVAAAPSTAFLSLLVFGPVVALYAVADLPTYALMAAVFALALPVIARALNDIVARRRTGVVVLLALVACLPAVLALLQGGLENIWSYHYTRGRLLLGYWHPKEAAASFALPMLLYILMGGKARLNGAVLLMPLILFVIGSRNVFLAVYLFIGLWKFRRATLAILTSVIVGIVVFVMVAVDSFDFLNQLTSLRMTVWMDALSDPAAAGGDALIVGSRLAIDSFYIELLAGAGPIGLLVFALWAIGLSMLLGLRRYHQSIARPLLASIIFFAAFDSGITSTGNVLHVTLWALALSALFTTRHRRRQTSSISVTASPATPQLPPATT